MKPRWQYRFDNFKRAFLLLREALDEERELSQLEQEGVIQRFEYTMELAWKVMRDYLESESLVLPQVTPRAVIRAAFESRLISDGETWMDALDDRNKMSHTYDFKKFKDVIDSIRSRYLKVMDELHTKLVEQSAE
ncbi:MAG: nucleotidyltransferase substrate binding protein [Deltaproteobacteria bacterium]|nr:nucleotidyltransferase substrate binding protein [Deltaproteobacteria bacterium]